jgi:uncharacterized membrane protein YvbJ
MKKIIHNLRQQSEQNKRHLLHITTIIFGVILIFIWSYSLNVNLNNEENTEKIKNDLKPFNTLKDNVVNGYNSVSNPDPELNLE